jgi:hypothetical protein
MRRLLHQILHCLPGRHERRLDRRLRPTATRRAQLVSFLEASGYRTHNPDAYERSLRRRRVAKALLVWASAFAVAWVVIESAHALVMF